LRLLATSANDVTFRQVARSWWQGFKGLVVAIYDVIVYHNAGSILRLSFYVGVISFIAVCTWLLGPVRRQRRIARL
jgi:hypothetical protein